MIPADRLRLVFTCCHPALALEAQVAPYLPAVCADLLRRLGRSMEAAEAYRAALSLATNAAERSYLARRLAEVTPA